MVDHRRDRRFFQPARRREQWPEPGGERDADDVDAEGEDNDVLVNNANCLTRKPHEERQRSQWVAHKHHVAGLGRHVGASALMARPTFARAKAGDR